MYIQFTNIQIYIIYMYIIIIINIIMLRYQHGSPRSSFTTRLYRLSLPGCFQGYILYRHKAVV